MLGAARQIQKVDIFESGSSRTKPSAGRARRIYADLVLAADQVRTDNMQLILEAAQLFIGGYHSGPYLPIKGCQCLVR